MSAKKTAPAKPAKKTAPKKGATKPAAATKAIKSVVKEKEEKCKYFYDVIGQPLAKRELIFHLRSHKANGTAMPHTLLTGFRGDGKSHLAKKIGRALPDGGDPSRKNKKFYPLNGSSIKNLTVLFNDVLAPHQDEYCTFFVDEAHGLPRSVQNAFLTILEPSKEKRTSYTFEDITYQFDFHKITFIFATTEDDKIFHALKDRLLEIGLQPYSPEELGEIITQSLDGDVSFETGMLEELSGYVRRNARAAGKIADYVRGLGCPVFSKRHLNILKNELGLLPFGLTQDEIRTLQALDSMGEMSLSALASKVGRPDQAMRKEIEPYLINLGLMHIDGKRKITGAGRNFLKDNIK